MKLSRFPFLIAAAMVASAHPMGNFSVSHYTRIDLAAKSAQVIYVLDLAEVPAFEMLRNWQLDAKSPQAALDRKASEQAEKWMTGLEFRAAGRPLTAKLMHAEIKLTGAGAGLATARVSATLRIEGNMAGRLEFEDHNFPERSGWKEIVIRSGDGVRILQASQTGADRSKELTDYAAGLAAAPQNLRASVEFEGAQSNDKAEAKIVPIEQPPPVAAQAASPAPSTPAAPGTVSRGDFLSRMLGNRNIGMGLMLIGIAVAFGLGMIHALSPGHGKTIVAAYLVGSRGTMAHAAFLGAMVTFTHTISVFLLGLGTLLLSSYVVPEKIIPVLGAISGLSIVAIGASLFYKRLRKLRPAHVHQHHHDHDHTHDHVHTHDHTHTHDHVPAHDHSHTHDHHHHDHEHEHDHGPDGHSHVPGGEVTLGSLIALGASGGLVPCPSALVLLLSSIALGHVGLGLILLVAFSLGLAGVLMAIGMLVLYARSWLPNPVETSRHSVFRLVPVLSAFVILCLGLLMTGVSLGWLRPGALIG